MGDDDVAVEVHGAGILTILAILTTTLSILLTCGKKKEKPAESVMSKSGGLALQPVPVTTAPAAAPNNSTATAAKTDEPKPKDEKSKGEEKKSEKKEEEKKEEEKKEEKKEEEKKDEEKHSGKKTAGSKKSEKKEGAGGPDEESGYQQVDFGPAEDPPPPPDKPDK